MEKMILVWVVVKEYYIDFFWFEKYQKKVCVIVGCSKLSGIEKVLIFCQVLQVSIMCS